MMEYIKTKDGVLHTVNTRQDFADLISKYMGVDSLKLFAKLVTVKVEDSRLDDLIAGASKMKKADIIEALINLK